MADALPSEDQLRGLPPRALVAYAMRCARRVQPLVNYPRVNRDQHLLNVQRALTLVETRCQDPQQLEQVAYSVACDELDILDPVTQTAGADYAVSGAARTAACAARIANQIISGVNLSYEGVVSLASRVSCRALDAAGEVAIAAARLDFDALLLLHAAGLDTPDDLSERGPLGPLWPDGPPDWYPAAKARLDADLARIAAASGQNVTSPVPEPVAESPREEPPPPPDSRGLQLVVEFNFPANVPERTLLDSVQKYLLQLDLEHRARGGHGLKVSDISAEATVPAEVPQHG